MIALKALASPHHYNTSQSQPRSFHNSAAARAAGFWDDPYDPRTQRNVARLFENAHFVPVDSLSDCYFSEYGRSLGQWPELPERGILCSFSFQQHPWVASALLSSTSPKSPLLTLFNLDTCALSSTPTAYLTLTLRTPPNPDVESELLSFHTLKSRLRVLCSQSLGDAVALRRMYQQVYGSPPRFPMPILADDKISTWGWIGSWEGLVGIVREVDDDSERWRRRRKGEKGEIGSKEVEEEKAWSGDEEEEKEKEEIWNEDEKEKEQTWDRDKVMIKTEDGRKKKENDGALSKKLVTSKNIVAGMTINHGIISPSSLSTPQCSSPQQSPAPQTRYASNGQLSSHYTDKTKFLFSALTPPVTQAPKVFSPRPPRLSPPQNRPLPLSPTQKCGNPPSSDLALSATSENEDDDMDWDKDLSADSWAWRAAHAPRDELESVAVRVRVMRCFEDTQYVAVEWLAEHYWRKYHRVLYHEDYGGYKLATVLPGIVTRGFLPRLHLVKILLRGHYGRSYRYLTALPSQIQNKSGKTLPPPPRDGRELRHRVLRLASPHPYPRSTLRKIVEKLYLRTYGRQPFDDGRWVKGEDGTVFRSWNMWWKGRWGRELGELGVRVEGVEVEWKHGGEHSRMERELITKMRVQKREVRAELSSKKTDMENMSDKRVRRFLEMELRNADKIRKVKQEKSDDAEKDEKIKNNGLGQERWRMEMIQQRLGKQCEVEGYDGLLMDDEEEEIGGEDEADDETNSISSNTDDHLPRVEWGFDDTPVILLEGDNAAPLRECDQSINKARPIGIPVIASCAENDDGMCKVDKGSNSASSSRCQGYADVKVGPTLRLNLDPVFAACAADGKAGPALRLTPDPARFGTDANGGNKIAWSSIIYPQVLPPRPPISPAELTNFSSGSSQLTEPAPARTHSLASRPFATVAHFDLDALSHATLQSPSRSVPAVPSSDRPAGLPQFGLEGSAMDKVWRFRKWGKSHLKNLHDAPPRAT
ncbi:hypothetical protein BC937DRAFT_91716 [Endogone sp. FLAS-F59071]|nr:hypothetical protein BC937DRAFT_91716 [Endogone sp. FLAS-F59071]|eukprot:RUS21721.1 hypothetical protein BC937DRAFT_91716 [Endogone sp. FLAS-F59071]